MTPGGPGPVLVTGGTGFIGGRLVRSLLAAGHQVRALVRHGADSARLEAAGAEIATGSLSDERALARAVAGCERVIHVAAVTSAKVRSRRDLEATNVVGAANVARAAAGAGAERLVHVSSCGVYGSRCPCPADETAPLAPDTPYRRSKARGERAVDASARRAGLPVVVARLGSVYGPGARNWVALCRSVLDGRFRMIGNGRNRLHPGHVDDIVTGLVRCAVTPGIDGRCYNLAGPEPVAIGDLIATVSRELGVRPAKAAWPAAPFRLSRLVDLSRARLLGSRIRRLESYDLFLADRCFDLARARRDLGYDPVIPAQEGMAELVAWYRAEGLLDAAD